MNMVRRIEKVAVIGSGIMGSGIACHFANIGVEVLLLDIPPRELNEVEQKKGLAPTDKAVRNRIVNDNLTKTLKSKPSPIYHSTFANRITTGNLEDDIAKIKNVDWIIEVVVERLDIKKSVFEKIEKHRTPGTLISSNTSGIPIAFMNEGRSEDFRKHFTVTHFSIRHDIYNSLRLFRSGLQTRSGRFFTCLRRKIPRKNPSFSKRYTCIYR